MAFGKLDLDDAQSISANLVAVPGSKSAGQLLCLEDQDIALVLARAYLAMDRDVWSNPAHIDFYRRTGEIIRDAIRTGKMVEAGLWELSDVEIWESLWEVASEDQRNVMLDMKTNGLLDITALLATTKVRTIDPDVFPTGATQPVPLSALSKEYFLER